MDNGAKDRVRWMPPVFVQQVFNQLVFLAVGKLLFPLPVTWFEIRWPDGDHQVVEEPAANRLYVVYE